jgi:hypothetical protein
MANALAGLGVQSAHGDVLCGVRLGGGVAYA